MKKRTPYERAYFYAYGPQIFYPKDWEYFRESLIRAYQAGWNGANMVEKKKRSAKRIG